MRPAGKVGRAGARLLPRLETCVMAAAVVALIWANSPLAQSYYDLWHLPLSIRLGTFVYAQPLHFWVNDALMTVFFLVVGMEIRREIHEGR